MVVGIQMYGASTATKTVLTNAAGNPPASIAYGAAPNIVATVTPDPTSDSGGVVQFFLNGSPMGSAVPVQSTGNGTAQAVFNTPTAALTVAGPNVITAIYSGSGNGSGSTPVFQSSVATG